MNISGFLPLTLLDFPGRTACTVFFSGCNLRCPFCHNAALISGDAPQIGEDAFFDFLRQRQGLLDGVCVSGGEPLLQSDMADFLRVIKGLGFEIKLDTNGTLPLRGLLGTGLVDYIAMDLKNSLAEYPKSVGVFKFNPEILLDNIEALRGSGLEYEFRTTVVKGLHTSASLLDAAKLILPGEKWFLQQYKDSGNISGKGLSAFTSAEMESFRSKLARFVPSVQLRGI